MNVSLDKLFASIMNAIYNAFGVSSEIVDIVKPNNGLFFAIGECFRGIINFLDFNAFQVELFESFLITIGIVIVMISVAWYMYGSKISDRFMNEVINNIDSNRKSSTDDT